MLTFYEHPLSPYARKVKICLYEKGIPFDRRFVNPYAGPADPNWQAFVRASPRREVPVLVDGDVRVFDSTIIADYIEEKGIIQVEALINDADYWERRGP